MDVAHRGLFVTGTVGAFLGTERENGEFHVQDVCWPGLPTRETSKATVKREQMEENSQGMTAENQEREDDEYVVLMSGLDLGGATGDGGQLGFAAAEMRLSLLTEWIGGEIGDEEVSAIQQSEETSLRADLASHSSRLAASSQILSDSGHRGSGQSHGHSKTRAFVILDNGLHHSERRRAHRRPFHLQDRLLISSQNLASILKPSSSQPQPNPSRSAPLSPRPALRFTTHRSHAWCNRPR